MVTYILNFKQELWAEMHEDFYVLDVNLLFQLINKSIKIVHFMGYYVMEIFILWGQGQGSNKLHVGQGVSLSFVIRTDSGFCVCSHKGFLPRPLKAVFIVN